MVRGRVVRAWRAAVRGRAMRRRSVWRRVRGRSAAPRAVVRSLPRRAPLCGRCRAARRCAAAAAPPSASFACGSLDPGGPPRGRPARRRARAVRARCTTPSGGRPRELRAITSGFRRFSYAVRRAVRKVLRNTHGRRKHARACAQQPRTGTTTSTGAGGTASHPRCLAAQRGRRPRRAVRRPRRAGRRPRRAGRRPPRAGRRPPRAGRGRRGERPRSAADATPRAAARRCGERPRGDRRGEPRPPASPTPRRTSRPDRRAR